MKKIILIAAAAFIISACSDNNKNIVADESGTVETTDVILSAQSSGKIINLFYDEGSQVKKGDTLIIIDHELYDLQLKQAIASKEIAKAQLDLLVKGSREEDIRQASEQLAQAETNFKSADDDKARMASLYSSGSVTKKQYDDAVTKYDVVSSQLKAAKENYTKIKNIARPEEIIQAKANYLKSDASVGLLQKNVRDCFVISPINGVVIKRFIEVGETVSMMSSLLKVTDQSKVDVVIYVSEKALPLVKLNQTAEVTTDGLPGKVFEGKVIFISPQAEFTPKNIQTKEERTKQVFAVKIEIPNTTGELKTGLPVDVKIKQ